MRDMTMLQERRQAAWEYMYVSGTAVNSQLYLTSYENIFPKCLLTNDIALEKTVLEQV